MDSPAVLIELGLVLIGLALLARLAGRFLIPTIPLYLLAGLAFGRGGILPLVTTAEFVEIGAEIGLILLLLMLGLEYSAKQLIQTLRSSARPAILDLIFNFLPGLLGGLVLGWGFLPALFLGGITYVSSSGVAAKLLQDLAGIHPSERDLILSILIVEDLAMAIYLPLLAALVIAVPSPVGGLASALFAVSLVLLLLILARRLDVGLSRLIFSRSDEALLLMIMGLAVLVAGLAELVQVGTAIGALLVGIVLSGPAAQGARWLLRPLHNLFAAMFFVFFGLNVAPSSIPPVLGPAVLLAVISGASKFASSWLSAKRHGLDGKARVRSATILLARGEFSMVVAGLGAAAGVHPRLGPVAVAYVLIMAVMGPLLTRLVASKDSNGAPSAEEDLRNVGLPPSDVSFPGTYPGDTGTPKIP